jgi:hypothetical protein
MKIIFLIPIILCFHTKAQNLPVIALGEQSFNSFIVINNKNILLRPVDTSFLLSRLVCQPGGCTLLPLRLLEFNGRTAAANNHLYWKTENEINTNYFEIQRSPDAVIFQLIGYVTATNTGSIGRYAFDDSFPLAGKSYYRLKMIDRDENFTYSKIILLERNIWEKISIYPNPANQIIKIRMQSLTADNCELAITDMAGKRILLESRTAFNGLNVWELNVSHITSGLYNLTIMKKKDGSVTNILLEIIH